MGHARVPSSAWRTWKTNSSCIGEILKNGLSSTRKRKNWPATSIRPIKKSSAKSCQSNHTTSAYQKDTGQTGHSLLYQSKTGRGKSGKGSILIEFYSDEELDSILEKIDYIRWLIKAHYIFHSLRYAFVFNRDCNGGAIACAAGYPAPGAKQWIRSSRAIPAQVRTAVKANKAIFTEQTPMIPD